MKFLTSTTALILIAMAFIAADGHAATTGEMTGYADATARTWTSPRSFAATAMVCTTVWIRGRIALASSYTATSQAYYRSGIIVRLGFRRMRAPMSVRYVSFTRPGTVRVRWTIVQRATDCN